MSQTLRNVLGAALVLAALSFSYAVIYYVNSYATSTSFNSPAFSVSGEGKAVAIPDIAQFSFSVVTEGGTDLASLQSENTADTNKVIEFLKSRGIEAKDIQTESYDISPRYQSFPCEIRPVPLSGAEPAFTACPPSEIAGYTVTQTVSVKVRNLEAVGELLSGVVENGANRTSGLTFTVDDRAKYENEARAEAIAKAKEKAKLVAEAGGFKVGKLLSVDEFFFGPVPFGAEAGGFGGDTKVLAPPSIEPGSEEITVTVNLRYEIR